jgi:ABC-type nitrate/sulfonate/bicarbonate transport system substrate-binding protein
LPSARVARERGLFKKRGLDMQYVVIPRSPLAVVALIAGEIDAGIIGPGHLINSASTGSDLVGVANFFQKLDYRLVARQEIRKLDVFRGKRVAISGPGAASHLVTMLAFQGMNIDPVQAKITLLRFPAPNSTSAWRWKAALWRRPHCEVRSASSIATKVTTCSTI